MRTDQIEHIAACCRHSAMILNICDAGQPRLQTLNRAQAELLMQCAAMIEQHLSAITPLPAGRSGDSNAPQESF